MEYQKKLDDIERRFEELTGQMADPAVISDSALYRKVSKQQSDFSEMVGKYREWKSANKNLQEARQMLQESDPELRTMAQDEVARLEPLLTQYEEELKVLMLPKDPNDEKDVVLEIRAGTGGDEATLFADEIFRYLSIPSKEFPVASKMFEEPIMTEQYFHRLADSFRSTNLWKWVGNNWQLRHAVYDE